MLPSSYCKLYIKLTLLFFQESVSCVTPVKKDSFVYSSGVEDSTSQGNLPGELGSSYYCLTNILKLWLPKGQLFHISRVSGENIYRAVAKITLCVS